MAQKDIAQAVGIIKITLGNRLNDMRNKLQLT
jgi:hypothetical protein